MSRLFTVAIALMCLVGAVSAHELRNSGGQFTFVPERGFHRAVAAGFSSAGLPGHPELPVRHLTCILPPGVKADSVQFKACDYAFLGEYYIYPAQPTVPLCSVPPWVPPDTAIYNSETPYPSAPVKVINRGFLDGAGVVTVAVDPLRYIPARREVYVASRLEFDFFTSEARPRVRAQVRGIHAQRTYDQALRAVTENRHDIPACYQPPMLVPVRAPERVRTPGPYPAPSEYTIITNDELAGAFQPYADWLTDKGVPADVIRLSQFLPSFPGVDDAERLRNYLIRGYERHGLVWVLLGGDAGIVPFRYGWTDTLEEVLPPGDNSSDVAPSDLYFSDLEGNWDADGDGRWGEPLPHDSVQAYPEVFVGRLTVRDTVNVQNWVNKMLHYEENGSNDLEQFDQVTWIYDSASGGPNGEGSLYPERATRLLFPGHLRHTNHDAVIAPAARDAFGRSAQPDEVAGIYSVLCHGSPKRFYSRRQVSPPDHRHVWAYNPVLESGDNAGLQYCDLDSSHYFVYDIGCYTAAFDSFISHGDFDPADTIMADAYTNLYPTTLGIAHLANTRMGLDGPSQDLQRVFWELFFVGDAQNEITPALGVAQGLSKVDYQHDYVRHSHNLFGSPELEPWVIKPESMFVEADPPSMPQGQPVTLAVQVTDAARVGISKVKVCLHKPGDIYEVGTTDSDGTAEFLVFAETEGEVLITCTYPRTGNRQYLPSQAVCEVVAGFGGGSQAEESGLPRELGFTAVGPSPAFRALTVKYGVPVQGRVRLRLCDVQGRIAAAITDEELKPGYYRQDISRQALSLPAGVYFLALTQHGNRVTRKVTLVE